MNEPQLSELADYVHDQLDAGVDPSAVEQALAKSGYDEQAIDTVFAIVADEREAQKPSFRQAVLEHHERHDFFDEVWFRLMHLRMFKGRLNRANFLFANIYYWAIGFVVVWVLFAGQRNEWLVNALDPSPSGLTFLLFIILISIVLSVFYMSILARRLHDLGVTGWWALIMYVPLMNAALPIFLLVMPGDSGENAYGPKILHMSFDDLLGLKLYVDTDEKQPPEQHLL